MKMIIQLLLILVVNILKLTISVMMNIKFSNLNKISNIHNLEK